MNRSERPTPRRWRGGAAALLTVALAACDETFVPIEATDLHFSIYGYLDAAADTQWVRVMPIRPLILTTPEPLNATVTIHEQGSGRTIELRDSVFRLDPLPDVESDGVFVHMFWTAERLHPGESYRLSVAHPELGSAEAQVELPPAYEAEILISSVQGGRAGTVEVTGAPHLPFAMVRTWFYDLCSVRFQRNFLDGGDAGLPQRLVPIVYNLERDPGCGDPLIERQEVFLVASGEPWPDGADYDPRLLGMPELPSNISNASGFLGGVMTRTLPLEDCVLQPQTGQPCRLRYGPETATLEGRVFDALCTTAGLPRTLVHLLEAGPADPDGRKLRPTFTGRSGDYRIGGLEPGRPYELRVSRPDSEDPVQRFEVHVDTLVFAPGELREYEVPLQRERCPGA